MHKFETTSVVVSMNFAVLGGDFLELLSNMLAAL
jgi:hypothetical protein